MIIDTHSHLQFDAYKDDLEAVLSRTREAGIACINVGTDFVSSKNAVEFAERYEGLYAAIGLHPTDVDETLDLEKYKKLALPVRRSLGEGGSASRRVVAIGEIGLDYLKNPQKEKQKEVFLQQADLAKELQLPLIIHCRMAHDEMIELLQSRNQRGVIHCFTGTLDQAKKYIDLGFALGLNGIMFKFSLDEVIKNIDLKHFLLETDCPYLTPLPAVALAKAGANGYIRNEPIFIKHTIQKIAELKNISFEEVAAVTTQNAKTLFGLSVDR